MMVDPTNAIALTTLATGDLLIQVTKHERQKTPENANE